MAGLSSFLHLKGPVICFLSVVLLVNVALGQKYADVRFSCEQCAGSELMIQTMTPIRPQTEILFQGKMDASGPVSTRIPVDSVRMIWLSLDGGRKAAPEAFYIEAGSDLEVVWTGGDWEAKGMLGRFHRYLVRIHKADNERSKIWGNGIDYTKPAATYEAQDIPGRLNAIGREIQAEIESDGLLSPRHKSVLLALNSARETSYRLFLNMLDLISRKSGGSAAGGISFADLPEQSVDLNLMVLSPHNSHMFSDNLNVRLDHLMSQYEAPGTDKRVGIYGYLREQILQHPALGRSPDFPLAYSLSARRLLDKLTFDEIRNAYDSFKSDYPGSPFLKYLDEILEEHLGLRPGAYARDFEMISLEGKTMKLSDFRGKLVYIDVWATWCAPCVAEFRYSKELSTKYHNREDLVFMYVSVDSHLKVWQKFLKENPSLKGVHGLQPLREAGSSDSKNHIRDLYKISGIPRYILIGKDGSIINHDAPRPSELVKSGYLDELLR